MRDVITLRRQNVRCLSRRRQIMMQRMKRNGDGLDSSTLPSPLALCAVSFSHGRTLSASGTNDTLSGTNDTVSTTNDTDICFHVTLSPPEWIFTLRAVGVIPPRRRPLFLKPCLVGQPISRIAYVGSGACSPLERLPSCTIQSQWTAGTHVMLY